MSSAGPRGCGQLVQIEWKDWNCRYGDTPLSKWYSCPPSCQLEELGVRAAAVQMATGTEPEQQEQKQHAARRGRWHLKRLRPLSRRCAELYKTCCPCCVLTAWAVAVPNRQPGQTVGLRWDWACCLEVGWGLRTFWNPAVMTKHTQTGYCSWPIKLVSSSCSCQSAPFPDFSGSYWEVECPRNPLGDLYMITAPDRNTALWKLTTIFFQ